MASTGCGKTLGNARIMNALADPALGMRCAFAIGLRTLTLQTGRSFQHDLGLNDEQLAIKVGGTASRALFEYWEQQAEAMGSASSQALLDEGGQVLFEGNDRHPLLERLTDDAQVRSLIAAPLLVCTVDHLTHATESLRGGRQMHPCCVCSPVIWCWMSLMTLIWQIYQRSLAWCIGRACWVAVCCCHRPPCLRPWSMACFAPTAPGVPCFKSIAASGPMSRSMSAACGWMSSTSPLQTVPASQFADAHQAFVQKRMAQLSKAAPRRLAQIVELPKEWHVVGMGEAERRQALAQFMLQRSWGLHQQSQNHSADPASGKRVSFGLIRMANIAPLFDVAQAMFAQGAPAPVCAYICACTTRSSRCWRVR